MLNNGDTATWPEEEGPGLESPAATVGRCGVQHGDGCPEATGSHSSCPGSSECTDTPEAEAWLPASLSGVAAIG